MTQKDDRGETARENDDSGLIDEAGELAQPSFSGSSGGSLAEDVATQAELEQVRDPEAEEDVTKEDDVAHGEAYPAARRGDTR